MNPDLFPSYFKEYIEKVPEGDPQELLQIGIRDTLSTLAMVSEERANESYEVGKWSIKDIVQHMIDTERIFCYRALAIARGESERLLGYNHDEYADYANATNRSLKSLLEEFKNLRQSTIDLFSGFAADMLQRKGNANGMEVSVDQLQYILIGHELHHLWVIQQKYLS